MKKAAVLVFSDPKQHTEEGLGRVFNALATAYDYQQRGDDVTILFMGTGSRWPLELEKPDHPAHDLYTAVAGNVAGVSCGCADVFGAADETEKRGVDLIRDNPVPGTRGMASLPSLLDDGYTLLSF